MAHLLGAKYRFWVKPPRALRARGGLGEKIRAVITFGYNNTQRADSILPPDISLTT